MIQDSLDAQLRSRAQSSPDQSLIVGPGLCTYGEAEAEVEHRSRQLSEQSLGGPVVLTGPNSIDWILNLLGLFRAQIPVVLIPVGLGPAETTELEIISRATLRIEKGIVCRLRTSTSAGPSEMKSVGAALAFVSSGSTGRPRLVLRSGPSLAEEGRRYQEVWEMQSSDIVLAAMPLCHAYAFGAAVCAAIVAGAGVFVTHFQSPRRLAAEICESKATILPLVPAVARSLASLDSGRATSSNLRIVMVGAGRVTIEVSHNFESKWSIALSQNFGSSETGGTLASFFPESARITGFPMPTVECQLVQTSESAGQLWVRLPSSPLGHISENGYEPARLAPAGWWPTGDLFRRDASGSYTMIARLGEVIRRGGHSIQPREIETALTNHPDVEDAVIRGRKDSIGEESIEAHIQLKPGKTTTAGELRVFLSTQLASHKLPHHWNFCEQLPRTWSSKVDVRRLQSRSNILHSKPGLMTMLMAYRLSEALIAAEGIGLMNLLSGKSVSAASLSSALGLDKNALILFLAVLCRVGVVQETSTGYILTVERGNWWKPVCALEAELRETWMRADVIADVLRRGIENRPFNSCESSPGFATKYCAALCEASQIAGARVLMNALQVQAGAKVLEIGRCIGATQQILGKDLKAMQIELIALAPGPPLVCKGLADREGE